MRIINLTKGAVSIIDDDDYEAISAFKWSLWKGGYAARKFYFEGVERTLSMHVFIMCPPRDLWIDHINGDGLDNRKSNLRYATNSLNQANRKRLTLNTSGYRGVCFAKDTGKWQAAIKHRQHNYYLGQYDTREQAAIAYDKAAVRLFGQFAVLNFPPFRH